MADATTHGTVAGTFFYMAPEVHKNERYNATVDIYSLGLVLYQFLNKGRLPFMPPASEKIQYGDMNAAFSMRVSGEKIPPIPDVSKELSQIICKACSYESKDRYQTATEFRQDLMEIKEILAMSAQEYNPADNDETISQEKEKPEIDLDWNKHEGTVSIFGGKEIEADSNPISEWCVVDSNPLPELFQKKN